MKFSSYNRCVTSDDGNIILINTKNSGCVKFSKEPELSEIKSLLETNNFDMNSKVVKALYENDYIVDDNRDEWAEIKQEVKEHFEELEKEITIMLYNTDNCNFRCIYCPQPHNPQRMKPETYDSVYKFIKKKVENNEVKRVLISFFGGEPLLEADNIVKLMENINSLKSISLDLQVYYDITTNAYLLEPQLYDKLTELGMKKYQITLDGFAQTHNIMRPLANGAPTWDKIVENLKYINSKKDDVYISLRTNHNRMNESTLDDFYKWAYETFDNQEKFFFALHPVHKFSEYVEDKYLADETNPEVREVIAKYIDPNNKRTYEATFSPLVKYSMICDSANKHSYAITTDGRIAHCENLNVYNDYKMLGHFNEDGEMIFDKPIEPWISGFETEECSTCQIYPLCAGRSCPLKKVVSENGERIDCTNTKEYFEETIISDIKAGRLL